MGRIQPKKMLNNETKINKSKLAIKTRKQLRKEKRVQKKINKAEYYQKKKTKNQPEKSVEKSNQSSTINHDKSIKKKEKGEEKDVKDVLSIKAEKRKIKDMKQEKQKTENAKKERIQQLKQVNLEENKMIKQLEKRLKLNKRKSKSIPKSFVSDGLDCMFQNFYNFKYRAFIYFIFKKYVFTYRFLSCFHKVIRIEIIIFIYV